ncbi:unnamed protein product [Fraxinus pennsylvanica]|uniref:holo-[acyl-carrier-protein] synthase n=1 Tax=Fraxinus pennsylvanica TaxID=56036 RepID=A0AAD1ZE51_9LAMI|nr:unnamed protein product [Fraxinus pennsylvanica]
MEEKHRTIKHNILSFAERYLSKDEVQFLADILDPEVQRQEFFTVFHLKSIYFQEAYVKALGKGCPELAGSHYAAICRENNGAIEGKRTVPVKLKVWKTIPFLEDECVSGTDAVKTISGLK